MISKQNRQGQCGQKCVPVFGNAKLVLNLSIAIIILLLPTANASFLSEEIAKRLLEDFEPKKHHLDVSLVFWTPTTHHVAFICCEEESSVNKTCILGNTEILGECNWPNADGKIFNPLSGKINMSESNSDMLLSHSQQCKRMYTGEESAPFKLKDWNVLPKGDVKNEIKFVGCTVTEQVNSIFAKKWSKVIGLNIYTIDNKNVFAMYIVRRKHFKLGPRLYPAVCMDFIIGSTRISCNIWFLIKIYIIPSIIYWTAYYYNILHYLLVIVWWTGLPQRVVPPHLANQPNGQNEPAIAVGFYLILVAFFQAFDYDIVGTIDGLQYNDF